MSGTNGSSVIILKRVFPHERERVFAAFASGEAMAVWLCAYEGYGSNVSSDFLEGGSYSIEMKGPDGILVPHSGEFREIVPGRKIVMTWTSEAAGNSLLTIELADVDGGTELTLRHELLPPDKVEGHRNGWGRVFNNLSSFLG